MVLEDCSWVSIGVSMGITVLIALLCWRYHWLLVIPTWGWWSIFSWGHPLINGIQSLCLSKWCNFVVWRKTLQSCRLKECSLYLAVFTKWKIYCTEYCFGSWRLFSTWAGGREKKTPFALSYTCSILPHRKQKYMQNTVLSNTTFHEVTELTTETFGVKYREYEFSHQCSSLLGFDSLLTHLTLPKFHRGLLLPTPGSQ